jgi:hypothetical protein
LADHTSTSGWTSPAAAQPTASSSAGPTLQECWVAINEYLTKFNGSQNNFTFLISHEEIIPNALLLDNYPGAAAAYSLRKLDKDYTGNAIRVRRASDNTEQDIGFDANGDLDTSALATFCSGTDGFVKTWYDQSGNGNDATQTTTSAQPKIYDSSTGVLTENGKPILKGGTSAAYMNLQTTLTDASLDIFSVNTARTGAGLLEAFLSSDPNDLLWIMQDNNSSLHTVRMGTPSYYFNGVSFTGTTRDDLYNAIAGSQKLMVALNVDVSDAVKTQMGWSDIPLQMFQTQEIIFYSTNQDDNRSDIETNINDYYSIY